MNMDWLIKPTRTETAEEKIKRLDREATKLEIQAAQAEVVAKLQKRIDASKKRIAATRTGVGGSSSGGGSGILGFALRNKLMVGMAVLIGVVLLIAKTCG